MTLLVCRCGSDDVALADLLLLHLTWEEGEGMEDVRKGGEEGGKMAVGGGSSGIEAEIERGNVDDGKEGVREGEGAEVTRVGEEMQVRVGGR